MSYRVDATFTVEISDRAPASRFGSSQGEQRDLVQAAADAGLTELQSFAQRYGFVVSNATATVQEAN
jgi:hypothetical protein